MTDTPQAQTVADGLREDTKELTAQMNQQLEDLANPEAVAPTSEETSDPVETKPVETEKEDLVPRSESNKAWVQKRKAEQRADTAEEELRQLKAAQTPVVETKPLTLEDHDFDEDALDQARINEAVDARFASEKADREESDKKEAHKSKVDSFIEKTAAYRSKTPSWDEDNEAAQDINFSQAMFDAVIASEIGPELQHALIKNPAEVERINTLPTIEAALAIGRMEKELMTQPIKPEKKTTSAPEPIETVTTGGGGSATDALDPDDPSISIEEQERRLEQKWNREHQG